MADTIKALSDNILSVTILIVGIADSVNDLIGDHPSIERCLLQIKMPRMSNDELHEIISNGINKLQLELDKNIANMIVEYSSGFPHYTHLLCKFTAQTTINNDEVMITKNHFDYAVKASIENANQSLRNAYQKATISSKGKTQFEDVIMACAIAKTDEYQSFSSNDVVEKFNKITNRNVSRESINYNLGMLCKSERGSILEKIGSSKNIRYKFKNPLMLAFIKLKLHTKRNQLSFLRIDNNYL